MTARRFTRCRADRRGTVDVRSRDRYPEAGTEGYVPSEQKGDTLDLTKEQLVEIYRRVLRIRRFDEKPTRGLQGLVWRQMLTLSLTFDHQGVDGTPAAAFLQAVCKQLEAPAALAE